MAVNRIAIVGASGFIGSCVLRHALLHPLIDRIFIIARKPFSFPSVADKKVDLVLKQAAQKKVSLIILPDFSHWPQDVLDQLKNAGVKGCIWCIGGANPSFPNTETAELLNITLPVAAAEAFSRHLAPAAEHTFSQPSTISAHGNSITIQTSANSSSTPFRFIYLSMAGAERNPAAKLWTNAASRMTKGAAENALFTVAERHAQDMSDRAAAQRGFDPDDGFGQRGVDFEMYSLRLARVLPGGQTMGNVLAAAMNGGVNVERVGEFATHLCAYGRTDTASGKVVPGSAVIENAEVLGEGWADVNSMKNVIG